MVYWSYIFIMGIPVPGKMVFICEEDTGLSNDPWAESLSMYFYFFYRLHGINQMKQYLTCKLDIKGNT